MGGYFNRGASAGGHDEGYFDREDITGPTGTGSATGGPGGVAKDDVNPGADEATLERDPDNPNIVRAVPPEAKPPADETAGQTSPSRITGTYPDIVKGSDSEASGTSWGLPAVEGAGEEEAAPGSET